MWLQGLAARLLLLLLPQAGKALGAEAEEWAPGGAHVAEHALRGAQRGE
jgi:hypothetical protein